MRTIIEFIVGMLATCLLVVILIMINGLIGFNMRPALAYSIGGIFLLIAVIGIARGIIKAMRR